MLCVQLIAHFRCIVASACGGEGAAGMHWASKKVLLLAVCGG